MSEHSDDVQWSRGISEVLGLALAVLLQAFKYAEDTQSDRWDFAVRIRSLHRIGLGPNELRWLVKKGYVQHASEVTIRGDSGRAFRSTGDLTFSKRTCFVLTDAGVAKARSLPQRSATPANDRPVELTTNGPRCDSPVVRWDHQLRKLFVNGQVAKGFKWLAANQETILSAFQEEGWPHRIDDPLPPQPNQDPKRRLSDTIKCLNRKQATQLIHFRGDGTGEGIVWELLQPSADLNGDE